MKTLTMQDIVIPPNFTNGFLLIDLGAVAHNYKAIQKFVGEGVHVSAVVKSNAYGLGIAEVSKALYGAGCRHFYVAHLSEGLELREVLKDVSIYALAGPMPESEDLFAGARITPVLNTAMQIELWSAWCKKHPHFNDAVLHFDTGMNRFGLCHEDTAYLRQHPEILEPLAIQEMMSHLACADDFDHVKNKEQLALFQSIRAEFKAVRYSLAASYGMAIDPAFHFNAVRPGKALYNPEVGLEALGLKNATFLQGPILQIKHLEVGETVGYSAAFTAARKTTVATVGIGYGDGYHRAFSNLGVVHIAGHAAPIIGRVSMDFVTIDVTDLPEHLVRVGELVEFFGNHQPLYEVAKKIGTISYELLTHLGKRYKRYYKE